MSCALCHIHVYGLGINSLSVYKVNVDKLKELEPDFIVTQDQCDVCAVSFSEVEDIVKEYFNQKTKIICCKAFMKQLNLLFLEQ